MACPLCAAITRQSTIAARIRFLVRSLVAPPGESRWIIRYVADYKRVSVFGPLRENMTSSTKPEVHNVLYCRQSLDRATVTSTCIENFVKFFFGHVVFSEREPLGWLYAIARPSVVCNVRAPYSAGWNLRQFFYAAWYVGHPLTSTEKNTEIVPGKSLR